jgi:hypothetical protein
MRSQAAKGQLRLANGATLIGGDAAGAKRRHRTVGRASAGG